MATSPTANNAALLWGAAKEQLVGGDGDFMFNIKDLLANDPGGAAKVDLSKQFFLGTLRPMGSLPRRRRPTWLPTTSPTSETATTGSRLVLPTSTTSFRSATRARGLSPTWTSQPRASRRARAARRRSSLRGELRQLRGHPRSRSVGYGQPHRSI